MRVRIRTEIEWLQNSSRDQAAHLPEQTTGLPLQAGHHGLATRAATATARWLPSRKWNSRRAICVTPAPLPWLNPLESQTQDFLIIDRLAQDKGQPTRVIFPRPRRSIHSTARHPLVTLPAKPPARHLRERQRQDS